MGIYTRKDSPWYWLNLERKGRRSVRESTRIPAKVDGTLQARDLRRQAEALYVSRMADLTRQDMLEQRPAAAPIRDAVKTKGLKKSPDGWCYVYVLQKGDMVKIGRALDVAERVGNLQTGHGHDMTLLAAVPAHAVIERAIHERFAKQRERGEWFRIDADIMAFIDGLRSGVSPIALLW